VDPLGLLYEHANKMAIGHPVQVLMFYNYRLEIIAIIWNHCFVWISNVLMNSKLRSGYFNKGVECVAEGKNHKCILLGLKISMIGTFSWTLQLYGFTLVRYQQLSIFDLSWLILLNYAI
jgi:hypothetical protein